MPSECHLEILKQPRQASLEDIESSPAGTLFALGIVNPFGPTLTWVAILGEQLPGAVLPVIKAVLNPFSQSVEQIATFTVGDRWSVADVFAPLLRLDFGSCPTLVLLHRAVPQASQRELIARVLSRFDEGVVDTFRRIRKHFGDPWKRVSEEIDGTSTTLLTDADQSDTDEDALSAADKLASLLAQPEHIHSELTALGAAWKGSIEYVGEDPTSEGVLSYSAFSQILFDRILPSAWLPEVGEEQPEPKKPGGTFRPSSVNEVREYLHSGQWESLSGDELIEVLQHALHLYGTDTQTSDIGALGAMYRLAVQRIDAEHRHVMASQLTQSIEQHGLSPAAFLPILVCEPTFEIVTDATIDFVSCSPWTADGELYAFTELTALFKQGTLENPGAVFGALVAMGDSRFLPVLSELRTHLSADQIRIAAQVHTTFVQHHAVQYWLAWAEELSGATGRDDQANFGSCASALVSCLRLDAHGHVFETERDIPCIGKEVPVIQRRAWNLTEYADLIGSRLYALEAAEAPPKIFSAVLRAWGLMPKAELGDQYIPPAASGPEIPTRLRAL